MIKFLGCLVLGHKWQVIWYKHYLDTSYGAKAGIESTRCTLKCIKCGKVKNKIHYMSGYLKPEDLV